MLTTNQVFITHQVIFNMNYSTTLTVIRLPIVRSKGSVITRSTVANTAAGGTIPGAASSYHKKILSTFHLIIAYQNLETLYRFVSTESEYPTILPYVILLGRLFNLVPTLGDRQVNPMIYVSKLPLMQAHNAQRSSRINCHGRSITTQSVI